MTGSPENASSATATAQPSSAVGLARIPHQADREISCRHCGTTTSAHIARLSGAWSVVDDRPLWDCDGCTRSHLREFETTDR